jgi:hypothetical protein
VRISGVGEEQRGRRKGDTYPLSGVACFLLMSGVFPAGIIYCPKCKDELRVKGIHRKQWPKLRHAGVPHTHRCEKCDQEFYVKGRNLVPIGELVRTPLLAPSWHNRWKSQRVFRGEVHRLNLRASCKPCQEPCTTQFLSYHIS